MEALGLRMERAEAVESVAIHGLQAKLASHPGDIWLASAPAAGVVRSVQVTDGEVVDKGQALLTFASPWLAELQRDTAQARAELAQASAQRARDETLLEEGIIPRSRLEQSRTVEAVARAALEEKQAQARIAGVEGVAGLETTLSAPFAGRVSELQAHPGQRVEAGAPLARVTRDGPLVVEILVPRASLDRVLPGARLRVGEVEGAVTAIEPRLAGDTQMASVRGILQPSAGFLPGQAVEVDVEVAVQGVRIPTRALLRSAGETFCFVGTEGGSSFRVQAVRLFSEDSEEAIVEGLESGAMVVVEGTTVLKSMMETGG